MEQLAILTNRKKNSAARLTQRSKIIKTIITAIQEKKGEHILSLDLRKINEAVADFFIICEAGNQPQIRAIADNVEKKVKEACTEAPYHQEGYQHLKWVLIDYVNVVVHIMLPGIRKHNMNHHIHIINQHLKWVLIDYVNVVVHIMLPDTRKFYRLEEMWSDATLTEHEA